MSNNPTVSAGVWTFHATSGITQADGVMGQTAGRKIQ